MRGDQLCVEICGVQTACFHMTNASLEGMRVCTSRHGKSPARARALERGAKKEPQAAVLKL